MSSSLDHNHWNEPRSIPPNEIKRTGSLPLLHRRFRPLPPVLEEECEDDEIRRNVDFPSRPLYNHHEYGLSRFDDTVKFTMSDSSESLEVGELAPIMSIGNPIKKGILKKAGFREVNGSPPPRKVNLQPIVLCDVDKPNNVVVDIFLFDKARNGGTWNQAARFVKYEEDVEGVEEVWSRPHVPFLPFSSIMALRRLLETKHTMLVLGVHGSTFSEVCHNAANELERSNALSHDDANSMVAFLNFIFEHAEAPKQTWIRKITHSGWDGVASLFERRPPSRSSSVGTIQGIMKQNNERRAYHSFSLNRGTLDPSPRNSILLSRTPLLEPTNMSSVSYSKSSDNVNIEHGDGFQPLLSLPQNVKKGGSCVSLQSYRSANDPGATEDFFNGDDFEGIQLLVGNAPIFSEPKCIVIRLNKVLYCQSMPKKPLRFIILILGPTEESGHFLELGRCFASFCINHDFLAVLYRMVHVEELLHAFDKIMNDMIMVPPMEVDGPELFNVTEYEKVLKRNRTYGSRKSRRKRSVMPQIIEEKSVAVRPETPNSKDAINMKAYGSYFQLLKKDAKKLSSRYLSDYTDVWQAKGRALITVISVYLSLLTPTITFAKILESHTDGQMGVMEALFATAICGLVWGLLSAQPLVIQGTSGPVVVFEGSFFLLCVGQNLDYLDVRWFAGYTVFALCFLAAMNNFTRLLKYVTAFTEEVFSLLLAAIHIFETFHHLINNYNANPPATIEFYQNITNVCTDSISNAECTQVLPNAGIIGALFIFLGGFLCMNFYRVRYSGLVNYGFRSFFADFNILLSLAITTAIMYYLIPLDIIRTADIPEYPRWTNYANRKHGLFIFPVFDSPKFLRSAITGVCGGAMVFLLLTGETSICELALQQKERKLKKKSGITWDLMVVGVCAIISSTFGLPWMCAAGVQSIEHAKGLSFNKKTPPGAKPEVDSVLEQRITTIAVALLYVVSIFLGRFINMIPVSCLFGVFMYIGIVNIGETPLFQGLLNSFRFGKYFYHTDEDNEIPASKIRLYRFLQFSCFLLVYGIKQLPLFAIAFPFGFIGCITCRLFLIKLWFTEHEINILCPMDEEDEDDHPTD